MRHGVVDWEKPSEDLPGLTDDTVRRWADRTLKYRGDEKEFVDKIVGLDPNVIDLKIGLPADRNLSPKDGVLSGST